MIKLRLGSTWLHTASCITLHTVVGYADQNSALGSTWLHTASHGFTQHHVSLCTLLLALLIKLCLRSTWLHTASRSPLHTVVALNPMRPHAGSLFPSCRDQRQSGALHLICCCFCPALELTCYLQAFPLTVELHLTELSLHISFAYLPSLGLVTAEADSLAGNELLATLFENDSGVDTPNEANKYIGEDVFVFDAASTARPYR